MMPEPALCQEGDLFGVPLEGGGYGVGLVARSNQEGVVVGYFFGERFLHTPDASELATLDLGDAVLVKTFGDLGLLRSEWPVIGQLPGWRREDWPMPAFGRRSP